MGTPAVWGSGVWGDFVWGKGEGTGSGTEGPKLPDPRIDLQPEDPKEQTGYQAPDRREGLMAMRLARMMRQGNLERQGMTPLSRLWAITEKRGSQQPSAGFSLRATGSQPP